MSNTVTNTVMAMRLPAFISRYSGRPGAGDTPGNRGQCVGLVEMWVDTLLLPHIWGNAADLLANAPLAAYGRIYNTPTNFPLPGDIVVWGTTWGGGFGHTGIAVTAHVMSFTAFQQNDPTDSPPHLKVYTYSGVLGWLRPFVKL
jgi:hypothetical protein